jgi:UDP-N-acetylmuramate dehydrogenase
MNAAAREVGLRGQWRQREALARYTSWQIGGPAERLYLPADSSDLAAVLASLAPAEPVFWIGLGSNLLIRDGGLRGTVISTRRSLAAIEFPGRGQVRAEAGAGCAKVARQCTRHDLVGAAFLAGIPGTIGGALAMNAGAWGGETWSHVAAVETVDRAGVLRERPPGDFTVGYRSVQGPPGEWFVAATFIFEEGDGAASRERIRGLLAERAAKQPTGTKNCGSVVRNPRGDHAARLIEAAGLKGARVGGAQVSAKHANFIINDAAASAADVETLIVALQAEVARSSGIHLQREVQIVGETT